MQLFSMPSTVRGESGLPRPGRSQVQACLASGKRTRERLFGPVSERLVELRKQGTGILLFSADLAEIMQISDRILVFYGGKIVAHIPRVDEIDENILGEYMLNLRHQTDEEIGGAVFAEAE